MGEMELGLELELKGWGLGGVGFEELSVVRWSWRGVGGFVGSIADWSGVVDGSVDVVDREVWQEVGGRGREVRWLGELFRCSGDGKEYGDVFWVLWIW
jgi:hypothetical protein